MLFEELTEKLNSVLADSPAAVVVENGEVLFDLSAAQYSLRPEGERCVLQIWSEERNIVRRVLGAEMKNGMLKLQVLRFGQTKPSKLEICGERDRCTPSAKRVARAQFQRLLHRLVEKSCPGWRVQSLTSAADLEHSFGPAYVRGIFRRGTRAMAVVGVSTAETQPTIDGAVSASVLWLAHCRERYADRMHLEGVRLFVPRGRAEVVRLRMSLLNHQLAKWELCQFDEKTETVEEIDARDAGNLATRLVQAPDHGRAFERFAEAIAKVRELLPRVEVEVVSAAELSFRYHGLEFARGCMREAIGSFRMEPRLVFATGEAECMVNGENESDFREFVAHVAAMRDGLDRHHPLYRMQPERWLESSIKRDITLLEERLDATCFYAQVPAFAASDRAMIDLLGITREGRLVVIELKAEEDLHLPLQGLDYWGRVRRHQQRGDFQSHGYFPGHTISPEPPLLLLAAPSLHVHPTTDTLLRHLSPEIEWKLLGLDEHWRRGIRVIFRKSAAKPFNG